MDSNLTLYTLGGLAALAALPKIKLRVELSRAKHPSLAGHSNISRKIAKLVPAYGYGEDKFFACDGAPAAIAEQRRKGFFELAADFQKRQPQNLALTEMAVTGISDMQFTAAYRVPFQFSPYLRQHLKIGAFVRGSAGVVLTDPDGNEAYDLAGSYGVNVFGYDFYKGCMDRAWARVGGLGPVLGLYHPLVIGNVERLRRISGLDEISFHMSGTEAVMQAVRLARYHTGKSHLVRFCGAYHGWWGDVQPGVGNPVPAQATYTLKEMDDDTLKVLRRRKNIACVLVNPLQALHPNKSAPGDGTLLDSSRTAGVDRVAYCAWLKRLREVCSRHQIVLIFDEVFTGFRLAPGGAQAYFGVRADLVAYGKTLGGGLPVGVVCGRSTLMKRYREDRPTDICFARGTFNAHPLVMATMHEFLTALETPGMQRMYRDLDDKWDRRAERLNHRLESENLPVRVANLSSIWTVCYTRPSRYNWMFQFYLRAQGLNLSWVGTGRFIFSLNYTEEDFDAVMDRFLAAARAMQADGWWWSDGRLTNKGIKRTVLWEMIGQRLPWLKGLASAQG